MSTLESTPTHLPWATLCQSQLYPPVKKSSQSPKRKANAGNNSLRELDASYNCGMTLWLHGRQGVTKRCRLSWLTNSALVYEPKWGCGVNCGASAISTAVHRSPKKLWRSNSIFNLWWPRKFCHWHTWDHGFWCTRHWAATPGRHFVPTAITVSQLTSV